MAFISHRKMGGRRGGKEAGAPFISFRLTKNGKTYLGALNKSVPLRGKRIDLQIDKEAKRIRIGECESGVLVNTKSGQFSCGRPLFEAIGHLKIPLTKGSDGWWYGSYTEGR